jgi:phosphatidylglycerophosphatase A
MNWYEAVATVGGIGRIKKAPGTWGTLAAVPLSVLLNWAGPLVAMGFILLLIPVGIVASQFYENQAGGHDHPEIVIDEVIGFLIAMTWLPMTWQAYVFGFVLFRFLDIVKPFPIGYMDKKIPGGVGVVADDVMAGALANIALQYLYSQTTWLGVQIFAG